MVFSLQIQLLPAFQSNITDYSSVRDAFVKTLYLSTGVDPINIDIASSSSRSLCGLSIIDTITTPSRRFSRLDKVDAVPFSVHVYILQMDFILLSCSALYLYRNISEPEGTSI